MKKLITLLLVIILSISVVSASGLYDEAKKTNENKLNSITGNIAFDNKITGEVIKKPKEKGNFIFTYDSEKEVVTIEGKIKRSGDMSNKRSFILNDFEIYNNRPTLYRFADIKDNFIILHFVSEKEKLGLAIPSIGKFPEGVLIELDDLRLKTLGPVAYKFSDLTGDSLKAEFIAKPEHIEINNNKLTLNKFYGFIDFEEIKENAETPSGITGKYSLDLSPKKEVENLEKYFYDLFGSSEETSPLGNTPGAGMAVRKAKTKKTAPAKKINYKSKTNVAHRLFGKSRQPSRAGNTPGAGMPVADLKFIDTITITKDQYNYLPVTNQKRLNNYFYKFFGSANSPSRAGNTPGAGMPVKDILYKESIWYKLFGSPEETSPLGNTPGAGMPVVDIKYTTDDYQFIKEQSEENNYIITKEMYYSLSTQEQNNLDKIIYNAFGSSEETSPLGNTPGAGMPVKKLEKKDNDEISNTIGIGQRNKEKRKESWFRRFFKVLFGRR